MILRDLLVWKTEEPRASISIRNFTIVRSLTPKKANVMKNHKMEWFLNFKFLFDRFEMYRIFITCLLLCQTARSESGGGDDSFIETAGYYGSADIIETDLDSYKYKQTEDIKRVQVEIIHKKVIGYTYNRELYFTSFGRSFRILLRRHLLFDKNIQLTVDNEALGVGVMKLTKYLPVMYVGIIENSPNSVVHGRVTDSEFKIFFEKGNDTYSVECPFTKIKEAKTKYGNLRHSLKNCQASKLIRSKMSELIHVNDSFDSANAMPANVVDEDQNLLKRDKRSTSPQITGDCGLKLIADYLYFENTGKSDVGTTVGEMLSGLALADSIFRQTDFNGDGLGDNHGFIVENITIFRANHEYPMKDPNLTLPEYLRKLANLDFSKYCVGVGFTHKTYPNGLLGYAYIGKANPKLVGGICQPVFGSASWNTAVVSDLHYDRPITTFKLGALLAHEFGHNFGSTHDKDDDPICSPGGEYGNFLMYPQLGFSKQNVLVFSSCSINSIYPVIVRKSPGCFKEATAAVCGNAIVEDDEECDCGTHNICQQIDPCCTPPTITSIDLPCKIKRSLGYQCSPSVSPCCSPTCHFYNATDQVMCQERTECSEEHFCESGSDTCPDSHAIHNGTTCNNGRQICSNGMCSLSICSQLNLTECHCTSPKSDACYVCCKPPSANSSGCSPINTFSNSHPNILKGKGDPCFDYKGFCDENGECILQQSDLDDGMNNLLSMKTVVNAKVWFKKYWYYLIAGILFITFLTVIITLYFKPLQDLETDAIRTGKLSALFAQAEAQKEIYKEKIKECDSVFENFVQQANKQQCSMSLTRAVARLAMFFPTASMTIITDCVESSSTEEFAVKMMLTKDFPMQTFTVILDKDEIEAENSTIGKQNSSDSETVV